MLLNVGGVLSGQGQVLELCAYPQLGVRAQDRVEEVQAALEELALEKERLLRRNSDLQIELQVRTCRAPHHVPACSTRHPGLE